VSRVTDVAAAVQTSYSYGPWGDRTITGSNVSTAVGFTGHRFHAQSGLWLSLYRGYDPTVGRWGAEDPLGVRVGPNLYAYVDGRPTTLRDPLGLSPAVVVILGRILVAYAIYEVINWCYDLNNCANLINQCRSQSTECANRLASDITSQAYSQRVQNCFFGNATCQTMMSSCGGFAVVSPPIVK
jgi:RHS repeat-associated protein